jgi:hypothetical protein
MSQVNLGGVMPDDQRRKIFSSKLRTSFAPLVQCCRKVLSQAYWASFV